MGFLAIYLTCDAVTAGCCRLGSEMAKRWYQSRPLQAAAIVGAAGLVAAVVPVIFPPTGAINKDGSVAGSQEIKDSPGAIQVGRDYNILSNTDPETAKRLEVLEAIGREILQRLDPHIYDEFESRFPLGYVLFYSDGKRTTIDVPDGSPVVDWTEVEVKLGVDKVVASAPQISGAGVSELNVGVARKTGAAGAVAVGDFQFVIEVLEDRPDGVVGVVGACAASEWARPFCEAPQ